MKGFDPQYQRQRRRAERRMYLALIAAGVVLFLLYSFSVLVLFILELAFYLVVILSVAWGAWRLGKWMLFSFIRWWRSRGRRAAHETAHGARSQAGELKDGAAWTARRSKEVTAEEIEQRRHRR